MLATHPFFVTVPFAFICCVAVGACGTLDGQGAMLALPPQVTYVQNINVAVTANVAPTQPVIVASSGSAIAPAVEPIVATPAIPAPEATPPSALRANSRMLTGIDACDAYIDRVEDCSQRMLPDTAESQAALGRLIETLDLAGRNWRRAAALPSTREMVVDSCETALRTYDEAVRASCP